ncbi:hypothetical protein D9M72_619170 [compost metagenome]
MGEPLRKYFVDRHDARHAPHRQHVHVQRNTAFELGELKERFHQDAGIDRTALRHQHDTDVFGRFVADVFQ